MFGKVLNTPINYMLKVTKNARDKSAYSIQRNGNNKENREP